MCAMALPHSASLTHKHSTLARALPVSVQRCSTRCSAPRLSVSCKARKTGQQQEDEAPAQKKAQTLSLAALLAAGIVLGGAGFPEDALAARSGGRIGGSSGFRSAPRSTPAPRAGPRIQNNYNNYSAPPLVGGYRGGYGYGGFSPFGGFGGGINVFPSFGVPFFAGSGFFNLILIAIVFSTVTSIVRSVLGGRRRDDFDDFD